MSTFGREPSARFEPALSRRLRSLHRAASPVIERLEPRRLLSVAPAYSGALSGKVLFTSGGHGYVWRTSGSWTIMRTYVNGMMEDLGNQDQLQPYADYALHAGATVVSMRPLGQQVQEVVVDNSDAGFSVISGSWSNSTAAPYWSNNSGNDTAHYRFANTALTETAVARFTPNIPSAGFWPVYAWYGGGSNRARDATFRINYAGGSQEVKVAQDLIGGGWVYLGNYYFNAGTTGNVELSNKSATTGKVVIADAIRFGNGMGDWTGAELGSAHPVSGQPRENECALYWCYDSRGWNSAGSRVASSVVDAGSSSDDETKNFWACDNFAAYMNNEGVGAMTDRLWISFHSNAGGGRGTEGLITGNATAHQSWLANAAGSTVQTEMSALDSTHEFAWSLKANPTYTGSYAEISTTYIGSEFDATIIEVAYHDNATDAALLKDPKVRWDVGRATMHTAIKYFDQWDPAFSNTTYLPEPPTNLRATTDASGNVTLNWSAGPTSSGTTGPYGNAASGYRVWTSSNGYGFDLAATLGNVSTYTLPGSIGAVTYYRVTALNAGGESLASWVVAAKPQSGRRAAILIVNNFQRVDDDGDKIESHYFGPAARARIRYNNSFDYVVQAADAVMGYNTALGVETATDDAIAAGQIVLSNYQSVIWLSGEQSTVDETFTSTTEPMVSSYLNAGGKLFVSGSEIAWDLMGQANATAADQSFYQGTLHSSYVNNDSTKHATSAGVAGTALAGVAALNFDDGTHGTYDVDTPDTINANGANAQVAMNYTGGAGGAVVQYSSGTTRVINMGFPFESIYTPAQRNALMAAVLSFFDVNSTTTGSPQPSGVDLLAATDGGQSSTDDRTNFNNANAARALQFAVGGTTSGNTVKLYSDGILIGSALASGATTNITTNGASALTNAAHVITATQTQPGRDESTPSPSLTVTIDAAAPGAPGASSVSTGTNSVGLDWPNNVESDLWGYNVFRSTTSGGPYTKISGATPIALSNYTDNTAVNGTTYFYVVTAVDTAGNESGNSAQATATPNPGISRTPSTPDLSSTFDTGPASNDNITRRNNSSASTRLQFFVNNTLGNATVTIFADGVAIGSTVASSASATVLTDGTTVIADGVHNFTATLTEPGKPVSPLSPPLSVTIDSTVPAAVVGNENPARAAATFDFTVDYSDGSGTIDPDSLDGNDVTVTGPNGYNQPPAFVGVVGNVATYRVPAPAGGTWDASDNGSYTVVQNAGEVEDLAGNLRPAGTIGAIAVAVPFAYLTGTTLNADYLTPGISIAMTSGGDNGNSVELTRGAQTLSFLLSDFSALVLHGTGGADTLESSLTLAQPVTFNGGVGWDTVLVHAGTFTFNTDAAATTSNLTLSVDPGAAVSFQTTQHLDSLTLNGAASVGPDGSRVLVTRNLTLGPAGTLDLNDNDFVLDYSTVSPVGTWSGSAYDGVSGMIQSARNGGSWDGPRGITSSQAQADAGLTTLGVAEASQLFGITGTQTALFSAETVDSTSVLIKFTYTGDANLDGKINVDDYGRIDFNVNLGSSGWFNGDFNYDGKINVDDYGIIDFNVGIQGVPL